MNELTSESVAIIQSMGLSNDVIYKTALEIIHENKLSGAVLDFGAGQGRFLSLLKSAGFKNISGVDLMKRPAGFEESVQWHEADLNKTLSLGDGTFDVIVAIEVIEHLENPRAMVRELSRLLRKGGHLIMSTPNNESIRSILALLLKGHFISFLERDYPAHITALTELDLRRILGENNFQDIQFQYIKKGLVPGLKGLTWQEMSVGLLNGKRFSDNVFVIAKKIT